MKTLLKNVKIFSITSNPFKGDVLIEKGKISMIAEKIESKGDVDVVDLSGKYLFPGFIDAHSHIGLWEEGVSEPVSSDGNEWTDPITAERYFDLFDVRSSRRST